MADFSIGSLLKKLPSAQAVAQSLAGAVVPGGGAALSLARNPKTILNSGTARMAAEGVANAAFPGAGTAASIALQHPQSVPVRGLVQGGATAAGYGAQLAGAATSELGVGLGLMGAGMGLATSAGSLGNEAQYRWNQLTGGKQNPAYLGPAYGNVNVPSGGPRNFGPDYKNKELAAGQAAENFRSGAGLPGQSPAAERAYQQQLSSTAQQVAQDPQLDAWSKQRAADVASKDYSKSEDMGMRIWAERHKDLAGNVKPGQAGYDTIQQVLHGTMQQPLAQNLYTNAPTFPSVENYANQQPNAIVRSSGIMPSYAMDNPMQGAYNSTVNQAYNLPYPIIPTTTVGLGGTPTNSAPMSAALYTPNSSTEAYGTYSGPPVKLPIAQTGFGAPGYPALTAGAMIPNVDVSQAFTANGIDPALRAKFYAMHTAN